MSELPKGWDKAFLGDVCEIARGGSPRPIQDYLTDDPEGINWIKISDATESEKYIFKTNQKITRDGVSRSRIVKDGDFILSNSMSFGRPYIVRTEGCIHDGWLVLRISDAIFDRDYLYYFLSSQAAYSQFDSKAAGSTVRNLNIAIVKTVEALIPPLNEQRRIVAKLDRLFARSRSAREELERVSGLCDRYKQAILAAAFRGDITADWREQNSDVEPASELLKKVFENRKNEYQKECDAAKKRGQKKPDLEDSELATNPNQQALSELPFSWKWSCIANLGRVRGGKRLPKGVSLLSENTGFIYIRAGDLKNGTVITDDLRFVPRNIQPLIKNYTVSGGDIYITIVGACIGDSGIIPAHLDGANLTENAAKISNLSGCNNCYLALWLKSSMAQEFIQNNILSSTQGKLALFRIKTLPLPFPPLEEQEEIVQRIEKLFKAIDLMVQEYQKASKLLDRLDQATLARAFRGELVPQNPNDEPAAALLERILTERPNQIPAKRARTKKADL